MLMHNSPETDGSNSQGNKIAANFQSRSKFLIAASAGFNNCNYSNILQQNLDIVRVSQQRAVI